MELVERSEEFHRFLDSLRDCGVGEGGLFGDYLASIVGAGTSTPFSAFVGQHSRKTIVISKHEVPLNSSNIEERGLDLLADLDLNNTCRRGVEDPFIPVISQQTISVGQPLDSSRVYLTHSSPFYRGWSGALIHTSSFAQDNGLIPLPLSSARFIASLYSLSFRKVVGTPPDVWVLCERNQRNIIALGCRFDGPQCPLRIFTVEGNAIVDPNLKADLRADIDRLSTGAVFSEYDIVTNGSLEKESGLSGVFKIQFSWNDSDGVFSPPPESANAILKLSNVPGDQFSPVLPMYEELQSLYRLCKISNGEVNWPASGEDDEGILASSGDKMADEVAAFIHDMAHPLTKPSDVTVLSPTTDHMIYEPRTDLDFTERLWLFCRDLRSFDDLQLVFAEVFKALLLGKIQPFVHRKSTSKLAMLLRQVLRPDRASLQDTALQFQLLLAEARLLPCLVQLGIEKMRRDYQLFFVGTDICSNEQFEQFFTPSLPREQCLELCRTHSVLELNATVMKMLRLPSTTILSTFTKAAMEVFKCDPHYQPFERTPVFSLPLPAYSPTLKTVVALCSKLSPVTWSVALEDDQTGKETRGATGASVVYLLRKQPFFHYLLEEPTNTSPQNDTPPPKDGYYLHKCYCETIH